MDVEIPDNTVLKGIVWSSSDENVAIVSQDGIITGVHEGVATITMRNAVGLHSEAVVTVVADTSKLSALINEAKDYKENDYTPKSWSLFMSVLKDAQKAVTDASSTQSKLDDMYTSLSNAMNALVHIADTTVLQSTIKEVEALNAKDYTEASWKAMLQVLTDAKSVLDDKNATQEAVNQQS